MDNWSGINMAQSSWASSTLKPQREFACELTVQLGPADFEACKLLNLNKERSNRRWWAGHQSSKRVHDGEPVLPSPNSTP
jgi:hypothetical protein